MSSQTTVVNQGGGGESHRVRGLVTLVAGIVVVASVVFAITAGAGAIWHKVTASTPVASVPASAVVPATTSTAIQVKLEVNPPPLGGVKGPDGLVHDAFVPATFTMTVGATYDVTIYNYDTQSHSWMSPDLNVSAVAPAGSPSSPSITHFTIKPTKAGTIQWFCALPCDKWAMAQNGFMRGYVTVKV